MIQLKKSFLLCLFSLTLIPNDSHASAGRRGGETGVIREVTIDAAGTKNSFLVTLEESEFLGQAKFADFQKYNQIVETLKTQRGPGKMRRVFLRRLEELKGEIVDKMIESYKIDNERRGSLLKFIGHLKEGIRSALAKNKTYDHWPAQSIKDVMTENFNLYKSYIPDSLSSLFDINSLKFLVEYDHSLEKIYNWEKNNEDGWTVYDAQEELVPLASFVGRFDELMRNNGVYIRPGVYSKRYEETKSEQFGMMTKRITELHEALYLVGTSRHFHLSSDLTKRLIVEFLKNVSGVANKQSEIDAWMGFIGISLPFLSAGEYSIHEDQYRHLRLSSLAQFTSSYRLSESAPAECTNFPKKIIVRPEGHKSIMIRVTQPSLSADAQRPQLRSELDFGVGCYSINEESEVVLGLDNSFLSDKDKSPSTYDDFAMTLRVEGGVKRIQIGPCEYLDNFGEIVAAGDGELSTGFFSRSAYVQAVKSLIDNQNNQE